MDFSSAFLLEDYNASISCLSLCYIHNMKKSFIVGFIITYLAVVVFVFENVQDIVKNKGLSNLVLFNHERAVILVLINDT